MSTGSLTARMPDNSSPPLPAITRRGVCPFVHSGHDPAYVAARRGRHRDNPADPVLRRPTPVVPVQAGPFRQTRGGTVAERAEAGAGRGVRGARPAQAAEVDGARRGARLRVLGLPGVDVDDPGDVRGAVRR